MRRLLSVAALFLACAGPALAALPEGARAPAFVTQGARAGETVRVTLAKQLEKGPVVLYFFPAAFTSGCNAEAQAFARAIPDFEAVGATVIGMSADPIDKLVRFSSAHCAGKFPVAQATSAIVAAYDVAAGAGATRTARISYVIAHDGTIASVHEKISPVEHVRATLAAVEAMAAD